MFTRSTAPGRTTPRSAAPRRLISAIAIVGVVTCGALAITGCGNEVTRAAESAASAGIPSIDGRGVSVTDSELVLRTADGDRTFAIRAEDVNAVGPEHIESHLGIESIGFKVYFITEDGVDYAVSVEEVDGSALGFD